LACVADVIQLHRTEHVHNLLIAACHQAIATGSVESVVEGFQRLISGSCLTDCPQAGHERLSSFPEFLALGQLHYKWF
jgi:hypothetical protein